jgi:hypothetical protein
MHSSTSALLLKIAGCIQEFTNLLRAFRISSLRPASGYLTPIGVDEPKATSENDSDEIGGR